MKWFRKRDKREKKREEWVRKKLATTELDYLKLLTSQVALENQLFFECLELDKQRKRKAYIS